MECFLIKDMTTDPPLKINKGSLFYCDTCRKMKRGEGYLYNGRAYCIKDYATIFPKWSGGKK